MFINGGFHICEFAYLLKIISNPWINHLSTLGVFCCLAACREHFSHPSAHVSGEAEQGTDLPSSFSSHTVWSFLCHIFSHFCAFYSCFSAQNGLEAQCWRVFSVLKHTEAVMLLTGKIHVLEELPSCRSNSVVTCEFHANESTIYVK